MSYKENVSLIMYIALKCNSTFWDSSIQILTCRIFHCNKIPLFFLTFYYSCYTIQRYWMYCKILMVIFFRIFHWLFIFFSRLWIYHYIVFCLPESLLKNQLSILLSLPLLEVGCFALDGSTLNIWTGICLAVGLDLLRRVGKPACSHGVFQTLNTKNH